MSADLKPQQTFDDSLLPEWAIHSDDQDQVNAFFGEPIDRGDAEKAFTIPRGETGKIPVVKLEPANDVTNEPVQESVKKAADATVEGAVGVVHEAEVGEAAEVVAEATVEEAAEVVAEATVEEAAEVVAEEKQAPRPTRADFAKFRCIYESQDGQLALYEDEEGHLTAVNTNRFI
ncbi:MAG: hypothetical protein IJ113_06950 [Eggerthellaceae bacterium]|nr:hypothetical protein [Eggerthellaceae bacterium]